MSIVWAGSEVADFVGVNITPNSYAANGPIDTTYVRAGIVFTGADASGATYVRADFPSTATHVRFSACMTASIWANAWGIAQLQSSTGPVCRIASKGAANTQFFQRWNGSAWVDVGTSFVLGTTRKAIMMKAVCEAEGVLEIWVDGALHASYSGDLSARGAINSLRLGGVGQGHDWVFSEVIAATHNIVAARLKSLAITGAGANAGWTSGAYTDIDAANEADNTFIASDTAGQKDTYVVGNLAADALEVSTVVLQGRYRRNATGPANINALVRVGGVDYGQSVGVLTESFTTKMSIWAVDPATSAPWERATVDALEIGVESVA